MVSREGWAQTVHVRGIVNEFISITEQVRKPVLCAVWKIRVTTFKLGFSTL